MKKSSMLALLLLTSAVGVSAAEENAGAGAVPAKEDKVRCKSEKVTGSRSRVKRICMTESQWEEQAARTKKGLDEMARHAMGGTNSAFDPANAPR
ncbi:MAG: hypothetical protein H6R45_284 [Proteobacteria bacterium]|nr:hypothetical protein [Pseudomonadota bacterium]